MLNEIYAVLRLYKNFCPPAIKLKSQTRQRVLESRPIDRKTKRQLRQVYQTLNPAELHRRLTELREQLEVIGSGKSEVFRKPAQREERGCPPAAGNLAQPHGNSVRRGGQLDDFVYS